MLRVHYLSISLVCILIALPLFAETVVVPDPVNIEISNGVEIIGEQRITYDRDELNLAIQLKSLESDHYDYPVSPKNSECKNCDNQVHDDQGDEWLDNCVINRARKFHPGVDRNKGQISLGWNSLFENHQKAPANRDNLHPYLNVEPGGIEGEVEVNDIFNERIVITNDGDGNGKLCLIRN